MVRSRAVLPNGVADGLERVSLQRRLGEQTGDVSTQHIPAAALGEVAATSPRIERMGFRAEAHRIAGLLVADLSSMWAGPLCGQLLARAGATVVKVESPRRPDGTIKGWRRGVARWGRGSSDHGQRAPVISRKNRFVGDQIARHGSARWAATWSVHDTAPGSAPPLVRRRRRSGRNGARTSRAWSAA